MKPHGFCNDKCDTITSNVMFVTRFKDKNNGMYAGHTLRHANQTANTTWCLKYAFFKKATSASVETSAWRVLVDCCQRWVHLYLVVLEFCLVVIHIIKTCMLNGCINSFFGLTFYCLFCFWISVFLQVPKMIAVGFQRLHRCIGWLMTAIHSSVSSCYRFMFSCHLYYQNIVSFTDISVGFQRCLSCFGRSKVWLFDLLLVFFFPDIKLIAVGYQRSDSCIGWLLLAVSLFVSCCSWILFGCHFS